MTLGRLRVRCDARTKMVLSRIRKSVVDDSIALRIMERYWPFRKRHENYARFEIFMAVAMKNAVFWNVTPRGSCEK
jgi:hypothetical protein